MVYNIWMFILPEDFTGHFWMILKRFLESVCPYMFWGLKCSILKGTHEHCFFHKHAHKWKCPLLIWMVHLLVCETYMLFTNNQTHRLTVWANMHTCSHTELQVCDSCWKKKKHAVLSDACCNPDHQIALGTWVAWVGTWVAHWAPQVSAYACEGLCTPVVPARWGRWYCFTA